MKTYTIINGSFRRDDGSVAGPGETIDLEDDVAAAHANLVQFLQGQHPVQQDGAAADADPLPTIDPH